MSNPHANGDRQVKGEMWGKILNDQELQALYRQHGGGGISSGGSGCLIGLACMAAAAATVIAALWAVIA